MTNLTFTTTFRVDGATYAGLSQYEKVAGVSAMKGEFVDGVGYFVTATGTEQGLRGLLACMFIRPGAVKEAVRRDIIAGLFRYAENGSIMERWAARSAIAKLGVARNTILSFLSALDERGISLVSI